MNSFVFFLLATCFGGHTAAAPVWTRWPAERSLVTGLVRQGDFILGATETGLVRIDTTRDPGSGRLERVGPAFDPRLVGVEVSADGIAWVAAPSGLYSYENGVLSTVPVKNYFVFINMQHVTQLKKAPDGAIWAHMRYDFYSKGLFRYTTDTGWVQMAADDPEGMPYFDIIPWEFVDERRDVAPDGTIWAVRSDSTVLRRTGVEFNTVGTINAEPAAIDAVSADCVVIGTNESSEGVIGVHQYDSGAWTHRTFEGFGSHIGSVLCDGGDIWLGTDTGVVQVTEWGETWFEPIDTILTPIAALGPFDVMDDGRLIIAAPDGLKLFDGVHEEELHSAGAPSGITELVPGPGNELWVIADGNVMHYADGGWRSYLKEDGTAFNGAELIELSSEGRPWVRENLLLYFLYENHWCLYKNNVTAVMTIGSDNLPMFDVDANGSTEPYSLDIDYRRHTLYCVREYHSVHSGLLDSFVMYHTDEDNTHTFTTTGYLPSFDLSLDNTLWYSAFQGKDPNVDAWPDNVHEAVLETGETMNHTVIDNLGGQVRIGPDGAVWYLTSTASHYSSDMTGIELMRYGEPPGLTEKKVAVISPNGAEQWLPGHVYPVRWFARNVDTVQLEYSTNTDGTWHLIEDGIDAAENRYDWTFPDLPPGTPFRVRISGDAGAVIDEGYADGEVLSHPIIVQYPNGGETWETSRHYAAVDTVYWRAVGMDSVAVSLSFDGGVSWPQEYGPFSALGGMGEITLPAFASGTCLVKVTAVDGPSVSDVSNAPFAIVEVPALVPELIPIAGGTFTMGLDDGDEYQRPAHMVTVSPFEISEYEITAAEWAALMVDVPAVGTRSEVDYVTGVTWFQAVAFTNALSRAGGLDPCYDEETWACDYSRNGYRLPTEAEWEYAGLQGGHVNTYPWGWYEYVPDEEYAKSMGVEPKEWCNEWYARYQAEAQTDPHGPSAGLYRMIRDGTPWKRDFKQPLYTATNLGFRVVRRTDTLSADVVEPVQFELLPPFPNPFNPSTSITFTLSAESDVSLAVYALTGQRIQTLVDRRLSAGRHTYLWDGRDRDGLSASSGVYLIRITAGERSAVRKMILVK